MNAVTTSPPAAAPRRRRAWRALLAALAALASAPLALEAAVRWWPYPDGLARPPAASTLVLDRAGRPLAAFASAQGAWHLPVVDGDYGDWLPGAVVAVEDRGFAAHAGVDWAALLAAAWADARAGRVVRGASTLTMQVQRLREPRARTPLTKLLELVRARQLERRLGKQALLGEWLERAPFGANLVGAGAAAWRWCGVPCRALTLAQAALLAGLPQNPARLRPDLHPQAALARRAHVLACMRATGAISAGQYAEAMAEPLGCAWRPLPQAGRPALLPACASAAKGREGVVATAYDAELMRQAEGCARALLAGSGGAADAAAVVVVENRDGAVRAAVGVGGPPALDLTRCPRSSGSTLKPFIYAAAFAAQLCTPDSVLDDLPASWAGFAPRDFDRAWRGRLTAAEALAESRNLPAMALLARLGVRATGERLEALGLRGLGAQARRSGLTLAVGGALVAPRDLALAYAALARGDAAGCGGVACRQALRCLADQARTAAVCPEAAAVGAAWKTGTSSGHRDAWCAAVTPTWTVVAWLGTVRGGGAPALVGVESAAPAALSLLAGLAPAEGGWGGPGDGSGPPAVAALPALPPPLAIVSPGDGSILAADEGAAVPRLALTCSGASGAVWWFADGDLLGQAPADQPCWWLAPGGRHALRVVDASGRAASVRIQVR